jgi:hypothetical protein
MIEKANIKGSIQELPKLNEPNNLGILLRVNFSSVRYHTLFRTVESM